MTNHMVFIKEMAYQALPYRQRKTALSNSFRVDALLKQDMLTAGRQLNNVALVETMVQESYPTLQWLTEELGVKFKENVLCLVALQGKM
ncbi:hypothetical protein PJF56_07310 [Roseofilum sp. BLCC_M91]|uniref:Uncharacterized protein n=1 Tax=Roseofilum halophilum BLCC-M91 TaxID=3022259 RepID=A0ABT7BHJ5_9CYAN|nr:hypothetical protein [Roseofilum halophilum]MDJ1178665.1 hypothetical protein [Roseofilum halophilum BLCC-M91]